MRPAAADLRSAAHAEQPTERHTPYLCLPPHREAVTLPVCIGLRHMSTAWDYLLLESDWGCLTYGPCSAVPDLLVGVLHGMQEEVEAL